MPRSTPGWESSKIGRGRLFGLSTYTRRSSKRRGPVTLSGIKRGGPDVYEGTGPVDWHRVRRAGYDVGIAKALEGTGHVDSRLGRNVRAVRHEGLKLGIYHFVHPGRHSPLASARAMIRVAKAVHLRKDEVIILDLEVREGHSDGALQAWADDYFDTLHREFPGHDMWEYSSAEFRVFGPRPRRRYWIAAYPHLPANIFNISRKQIVMHQYTDHATVPGIAGHADLSHVVSG